MIFQINMSDFVLHSDEEQLENSGDEKIIDKQISFWKYLTCNTF